MNPLNNQTNQTAQVFPQENHIKNIEGFLTVREDVPSTAPKKFSDYLVLVRSGGSTRAYFYDSAWRYATLT